MQVDNREAVVFTPAEFSAKNRTLRVLLYSHDTMGLGHIRRNLLIAQCLVESKLHPHCLLIAGVPLAKYFLMPRSIDCLALPSIIKDDTGKYCSPNLQFNLQDLINLRSRLILAAIMEYRPDILIVDKVPRGALRELDPTLHYLKKKGNTLCVLGLRDILDSPKVVQKEWAENENEEAIRQFYDAVWVYGDRSIYDLSSEYRFSAGTIRKIRYTGYHDQRLRLRPRTERSTLMRQDRKERYALCLVGGGQDGSHLVETFCDSIQATDMRGVVLTGPFLPADSLSRLKWKLSGNRMVQVIQFLSEPAELLEGASKIVCMGGYNTITEVLSFEKRALVIPRVMPRKEQLIRAECFNRMGLVDVVYPDDLSQSVLTAWLKKESPPMQVNGVVDMNGLTRIPQLAAGLLAAEQYAIA